jgi:hypothetical protein
VRPPPIRYPLPTILVAGLVALISWRGAALARPWVETLRARWHRTIAGPDYPASDRPKVVAGPIVRRALVLRDDLPASATPGGPAAETIRRRMIACIYDEWPLSGPPAFERIGTSRRPIGWVAADSLLPWDTRLVIQPPGGPLRLAPEPDGAGAAPVEAGSIPLPVLAWRDGSIQVAAWDRDHPWSRVAWIGWARSADLPADSWGVLLSQEEIDTLLRQALSSAAAPTPADRLRSLLGLAPDSSLTASDLAVARAALPPIAFEAPSAADRAPLLAAVNARPAADASWGGFAFRFVPLKALPPSQ